MTFHVRLIRDIPIRKGPLLAQSGPHQEKNYAVSANVKETADAAQRAIRSRLTGAATIADWSVKNYATTSAMQSRFSVLKN